MQTVNSLVDDLKLLPHPEADTTTTLMYVTIDTAKVYSQGGQGPLIYTSITNYRINANNTLTPIYKQVQATNIATQGQGNQTIYENYKQ